MRRRALVHYQFKDYRCGIVDLESYLGHAPDREGVAQFTVLQSLRGLEDISGL